jgi:hypothetical protein
MHELSYLSVFCRLSRKSMLRKTLGKRKRKGPAPEEEEEEDEEEE